VDYGHGVISRIKLHPANYLILFGHARIVDVITNFGCSHSDSKTSNISSRGYIDGTTRLCCSLHIRTRDMQCRTIWMTLLTSFVYIRFVVKPLLMLSEISDVANNAITNRDITRVATRVITGCRVPVDISVCGDMTSCIDQYTRTVLVLPIHVM
jgi:hypothetical protein